MSRQVTYGALTPEDIEVLELVLYEFRGKPLKLLEIGIYHGHTARGVRDFCAGNGTELEYWGIESGTLCAPAAPFAEAHFIIGESREVFMQVPDDFDVVFVDGDHTFNAVVLDALHYGRKVKAGGFLLFHDCAPHIQYKLAEPNRNYPEHPWFHNAVNDALEALGFTSAVGVSHLGWELVHCEYHTQCAFGGMRAYRKV